ncbi:glycosyltransferase family 39 protein, partial [Candidatus Woesearchaeota archaeon]|nr:glycosyltransferase family 39 protein [Candidatus Woesearchaeota archaeon]
MVYFSIALFFVYAFCLGFTVTSFVKNSENFLERNLMRIGVGLSMLPFIGLVLNLFHIPLDWSLVLVVSLAYPIYYILKYRLKKSFNFKITKHDISILVMLLIFFANLYIYTSGAFSYPYLEDDDSWSHALSVKYVSIEKTVNTEGRLFHYISPYPPTYDMLLGILHQTNDSVYFTLKFFNALIIALSTIFFYFFVKEFTQNKNKALFATFALMSVPAFMSHFIWALALSVPLYFVCFYALERIKYDNKWWIVAGLSMVTTFTSSPTHSTYFGLFLALYLITKMILERNIMFYHSIAGFLGVVLSFLLWWLPMIIKYGIKGTLQGVGLNIGVLSEEGAAAAFRGTGDRIYTFSDFFIAQKQNMINNPIGIGIFLSILAIIGILFAFFKLKDIFKKDNHWLVVALIWFVFTLYAVNGARFTIKLSPFRAWMLLAIPVCILAAEGALNFIGIAKQLLGNIGKYS